MLRSIKSLVAAATIAVLPTTLYQGYLLLEQTAQSETDSSHQIPQNIEYLGIFFSIAGLPIALLLLLLIESKKKSSRKKLKVPSLVSEATSHAEAIFAFSVLNGEIQETIFVNEKAKRLFVLPFQEDVFEVDTFFRNASTSKLESLCHDVKFLSQNKEKYSLTHNLTISTPFGNKSVNLLCTLGEEKEDGRRFLFCTAFDNTKNELVLARSQAIEELVRVGVWSLNLQNNNIWLSDRAYEILNVNPSIFKPNLHHFISRIAAKDTKAFEKALADARLGKSPSTEFSFMDDKGAAINLHMSMSLSSDDKGMPEYIHGICATEAKCTGTQKKPGEETEHQNVAAGLGEFFNNSFDLIIQHADLLEDLIKDANPSALSILEDLKGSAESGSRFASNLMGFTYTGRTNNSSYQIHDELKRLLKSLNSHLPDNINVVVSADDHLWEVGIQPIRFDSAISQIINNSVQAMPDGGTISIFLSNVTLTDGDWKSRNNIPNGEYVEITISDEGNGLPPEFLSGAQETFYSTDSGFRSSMGLTSVSKFIDIVNGYLSVDSLYKKGVTVSMILPRMAGISSAHAQAAGENIFEKPADGQSVLILEDDETVNRTMTRTVDSLGYQTYSAYTPEQAFAILEKHDDICLIISDIMISSHTNGVEFVKQAKNDHPELKAIFVSGYPEASLDIENIESLGIPLLRKPIRRATLANVISKTLGSTSTG